MIGKEIYKLSPGVLITVEPEVVHKVGVAQCFDLIVYLRVNVNFPETRATGNLMSYGVSFGQRPGSKLKQTNPPILLKKGETLDVFLEKEKEKIYKFINERQPIESIKKVELEISFIIFEDKTAWSVGTFKRQDPENSDRYNPEPPR
jgi:hypothetical protein